MRGIKHRAGVFLAAGDHVLHAAKEFPPFMIRPGSRLRTVWDVMTAVVLVYVALSEPYVVAFDPPFATNSGAPAERYLLHS